MTSRLMAIVLACSIMPYFLLSCAGKPASNAPGSADANASTAGVNPIKTNVEELGMFVNIPFETEETVWRSDAGQKKIVAILRFSPADSEKIVADAQRIRPSENVVIPSEAWFPDELIAQGDISGDDTLRGSSYAADQFFQDTYNDGRIVRIEGTNYFILEATSK